MNVLWETMIGEVRATYRDFDARRHFTAQNTPITETRATMDELSAPQVLTPEQLHTKVATSATKLRQAADSGFVEVG